MVIILIVIQMFTDMFFGNQRGIIIGDHLKRTIVG